MQRLILIPIPESSKAPPQITCPKCNSMCSVTTVEHIGMSEATMKKIPPDITTKNIMAWCFGCAIQRNLKKADEKNS